MDPLWIAVYHLWRDGLPLAFCVIFLLAVFTGEKPQDGNVLPITLGIVFMVLFWPVLILAVFVAGGSSIRDVFERMREGRQKKAAQAAFAKRVEARRASLEARVNADSSSPMERAELATIVEACNVADSTGEPLQELLTTNGYGGYRSTERKAA